MKYTIFLLSLLLLNACFEGNFSEICYSPKQNLETAYSSKAVEDRPCMPIPDFYDYFLFKRVGGGSKFFTIKPTLSPDSFEFNLTYYHFKDTSALFFIKTDTSTQQIFETLRKTLTFQNQITGDFKQPTAPTGTWSYLYMVNDTVKTEITNIDLRNQLLGLENILEKQLNH